MRDFKKEENYEIFTEISKALMLPVACLPICGILMGIGYALCPETMQGGDITGVVQQIGSFLLKQVVP